MYITWDQYDKWTTWIGKRPKWVDGNENDIGHWSGEFSEMEIPRLTGWRRPKFPTLWQVTDEDVSIMEVHRDAK